MDAAAPAPLEPPLPEPGQEPAPAPAPEPSDSSEPAAPGGEEQAAAAAAEEEAAAAAVMVEGHEVRVYNGVYSRAGEHAGWPRYERELRKSRRRRKIYHLYYHAGHRAWFLNTAFTPEEDARESWVQAPFGQLPTGRVIWHHGLSSRATDGWREGPLTLTAFTEQQCAAVEAEQTAAKPFHALCRNPGLTAEALAAGVEVAGGASAPWTVAASDGRTPFHELCSNSGLSADTGGRRGGGWCVGAVDAGGQCWAHAVP
jgi:hypothetical protein